MTKPANKNPIKTFFGTFIGIFLYPINNNMKPTASNILYQTKGIASREINFPKTAVNPQINTMK